MQQKLMMKSFRKKKKNMKYLDVEYWSQSMSKLKIKRRMQQLCFISESSYDATEGFIFIVIYNFLNGDEVINIL